MTLSKSELFDVWVAHLDEKDQNSKVKRYVGQHVLFNAITDADIKESITKKVETFLSRVRSRWVQSRRSRHNFLTKNSEWLKGNVLDIETILLHVLAVKLLSANRLRSWEKNKKSAEFNICWTIIHTKN